MVVGIGFIGTGFAKSVQMPAFAACDGVELVSVASGSLANAEAAAKQFGLKHFTGDWRETVAHPDVDLVCITTPPNRHKEMTLLALKHGKHVLCEKPMAMTVAECQSMIDACNKNKVKLSIGYRLHHEPNTQKIIQFRKDKKYGSIKNVEAYAGYVDNRTNHWKQIKSLGGGCMYDMGVYPLNAARYVTGEEPVAVTAQQSTTRPEIYKEVDETIHFKLEFPSGAIADCEASFGKNMNYMKADCAKGWYRLEPFSGYNNVGGETSDGIKIVPAITEIPHEQVKQMDEDALAIMNNKPVLVPGEEGLKDIRIVESIYRSVREKGRVIIG